MPWCQGTHLTWSILSVAEKEKRSAIKTDKKSTGLPYLVEITSYLLQRKRGKDNISLSSNLRKAMHFR
jgi:hypothetical protein